MRFGRRVSSLPSKQIEELAQGEVKFPLYYFLRDLESKQSAKLEDISREIGTLQRDFGSLKERIARIPLVVLGAAAGGITLAQLLGYQLRLVHHSEPSNSEKSNTI